MATVKPLKKPTPTDVLIEEFVVSAGFRGVADDWIYSVPYGVVDERTQLYGYDVYSKMLLDEDVFSALETRALLACSEGVRFEPAPGADPENANDIRNIYRSFVERAMAGVGELQLLALEVLMDGLAYGSKVGEITYGFADGEDAGRIVPARIAMKPGTAFSYVTNSQGELLGISPKGWLTTEKQELLKRVTPTQSYGLTTGMVPREKVFYFAHRPKDGSVTGSSVLNPAYVPWFMKTKVIPEFLRFVSQFASPSIVGKLPKPIDDPGALSAIGEDTVVDGTLVRLQKLEVLKNELMKFRNGYALAVRGGTEIDLLKSEGSGEAYQFAMKYFGDQITVAILGTAQATKEANHESRSSKDVGQDILGLRTATDRIRVAQSFTWLARELIRINFGEQSVRNAPRCRLTKVEQQDRWKAIETLASAYAKDFIKEPQLAKLYQETGLPDLPEGWLEEQEEIARMMREERQRLFDPA